MDRRGFLKTTLTGLAVALAGPYVPTVERVMAPPLRTQTSLDRFEQILREAYAPALDMSLWEPDPVYNLLKENPPWRVNKTR